VSEELPRIALVTSSFHPHVGGVEEHVRRVATALGRLGHPVVIWTVDRGEHLGVDRVDGILVRYLPTPLPAANPAALVHFAREAPAAYRAWTAAFRADRPDLLHVHCFGPNGLYAAALARRTGTPLLVTSHGETVADDHDAFGQSWQLRRGLRWAVAHAAAVTGVSHSVVTDLRERFGLTAGIVVPNGVDLGPDDRPSPDDRPGPTHPRPPTPGTVFAVGRLEAVKGYDLLVEALPHLRATVADARLRLGGSGSQEAALRATARRLGVADAVEFLGRLTPDQVADEMASADVVVVPSRREAFGIVVLEAWRSDTALVATDRDGPAELIRDGVDGVLVDPTDPQALASAVARVLADPPYAARLAAAGRRRVQEFTWDPVAEAYSRLYRASARGRS